MRRPQAPQTSKPGSSAAPAQFATSGPLEDAAAHADLVSLRITVDLAEGAQFGELVQDQLHGGTDLLVGIEDHFTVRQFQVAARDGENQFPTLGLVEFAT